jgi:acyl carrier protein
MSTAQPFDLTETLFELFWQSLAGGSYDLDDLKRRFRVDSTFQEFLIDSLDLTDFLLRVKDQFQVQVPLENLPNITSLQTLERYIRAYQHGEPATIGFASL